ncbi:MAG: B12-binding domain-containing radical SAM protein, partial [Clostridia bacterium]|nr:B12-binding domain-containing radical SAM protein [Clostridia bacterium]
VSGLEAVFSRGDRRVAEVLRLAVENGCMFDSWTEFFNKEGWDRAFEEAGIDPAFYANRERALDEVLPWSHIDCGVSMAYFKREYERSLRAETTPDCRKGCEGCGMKRYEGACR